MALKGVLVEAGYDILAADSGNASIETVSSRSGDIKGGITDIKLGNGVDGWQVAQSAREIVASMPIVYMSGDSDHEWASRGVQTALWCQSTLLCRSSRQIPT